MKHLEKNLLNGVLRDRLCWVLGVLGGAVCVLYIAYTGAIARSLLPGELASNGRGEDPEAEVTATIVAPPGPAEVTDEVRAAVTFLTGASSLGQLVITFVFVLLLTGFIPRYWRPYYILWLLGWISWLFMYAAKTLHQLGANMDRLLHVDVVFDNLNTVFFLLSGLVLLFPTNRFFSDFIQAPNLQDKNPAALARWVAPAVWFYRYLISNPLRLVLVFTLPIVALTLTILGVDDRFMGIAAIVAIVIMGLGISSKMHPISPGTSAGCLFVHAIYLTPQINALILGDELSWERVVGVSAPAALLKPVLGLFVSLLVFRETVFTSRSYKSKFAHIFEQAPQAAIALKRDLLVTWNRHAKELLNLHGRSVRLQDLFCDATDANRFTDLLQDAYESLEGAAASASVAPFSTRLRILELDASSDPFVSVKLEAVVVKGEEGGREAIVLLVEEREADLAEIACMAVHDYIKPRLDRINTNIELLQNSKPEELAEKGRKRLSRMREVCGEAIAAGERIRNEFLASKSVRGAARSEVFDLLQCVKLAWSNVELDARDVCIDHEIQLAITVRVESSLYTSPSELELPERFYCPIRANRDAVTQLIRNLLTNAIAATIGVARSRSSMRTIELSLTRKRSWVELTCTDHGVGFVSETIAAVNERRPCGPERIGMGLLIGMMNVARWGGRLHLANRKDGGAVVTAVLKLDTATASGGNGNG